MSRFTVVIPTFNRAHLLPRCLESVFRQTCRDFEIVVADDGSTDETEETVRRLGEDAGVPVRYVRQPNRGAGDARNLGASIALGEYLTFLDSDDEALPEWLQELAAVIEASGADLICCGCLMLDADGRLIAERLPKEPSPERRFRGGYFLSGTFVLRKTLFDRVGGYASGLPANQHSELRMRLYAQCEAKQQPIVCHRKALVVVHEHRGPKVRKNIRAVYEGGVYVLETHARMLREHPASYADWAAAVGGCAARLGEYREAARWFLRAMGTHPLGFKNYARLLIAATPGLRGAVWPRTAT